MQFRDEEDKYIESLIERGYIYPVGFDDEGEVLYQSTDKFRREFPEMFAEQMAETNMLVFDLWTLGVIDVSMKEDVNEWVVIPNDRTFTCDLNELTSAQRNLIRQLRYRSKMPGNGII